MEGLGVSLPVLAVDDNELDASVFLASRMCKWKPNVQGVECGLACIGDSTRLQFWAFTSQCLCP